MAADDDPRYWAKLRKQFLLREDEVFLNTATLGTPPRLQARPSQLVHRLLCGESHPHEVGRLLGAEVEELALIQNATMGMNFIAAGLDLAPGDEILQTDPALQCLTVTARPRLASTTSGVLA